jgi:hypothetical protein
MTNPKNAMEIFLLLDRSNCRKCGEKTCLAFAGAVFRGVKTLESCPKLDAATLQGIAGGELQGQSGDEGYGQNLAELQQQVVGLDLVEAAKRLGVPFVGDRLTLKILGKDFAIDQKGGFSSTIHINPWVAVPFLTYVLRSTDIPVAGEWISFREITGGPERYALFRRRAEEAMKRVADIWPDLFDDIVHLFEGRHVEPQFASDISVVLQALPRVPLMICYWRESEGIASSLNIFFDRSVGEHLDIAAVYMLAAGLTQMFEKLALQQGFPVQ